MTEIELHPGTPFCTAQAFNRIARQQGLEQVMAKAVIFDEICQAIDLPSDLEAKMLDHYWQQANVVDPDDQQRHLQARGWSRDDLLIHATRFERLNRFQTTMFSDDVELRFLECKNDLDSIHYSLIRLQDGDLAFELHQRLIEAEASFEELAMAYSEGPERNEQGRIGPVPLSQPHPLLMNVLRTSQPGQIRDPLLINDTWVIVRLDQWDGARLDDATREQLLEELFESWIQQRAAKYLSGEMPDPLPLQRLRSNILQ